MDSPLMILRARSTFLWLPRRVGLFMSISDRPYDLEWSWLRWQVILEVWTIDPITNQGIWYTIARGNRTFMEELFKLLQPMNPASPSPPKGRKPRPKHLRIVA